MVSRVTFGIGLVSISLLGHSQPWQLRKEKNGIAVYDLKTKDSKFNSIKVEAEMTGRIDDLVAILFDVPNHNQWAYGTKSASVLKRISAKEIIFYKEIKSPSLVVDNRDIVIHMKVIPDLSKKRLTIQSMAMPNYIPLKQNLVRVPFSNETWIISPTTSQKIKINYFLQIDPGGALPPLLVNMFVTKGPYETFENIRELLKKRMFH